MGQASFLALYEGRTRHSVRAQADGQEATGQLEAMSRVPAASYGRHQAVWQETSPADAEGQAKSRSVHPLPGHANAKYDKHVACRLCAPEL